jgi:acetyl esterase/lipase
MMLFVSHSIVVLKKKNRFNYMKIISYMGFIFALLEVLFIFHYHYYLFCMNAFASIIIGFAYVILNMILHYKNQFQIVETNFQKLITVVEVTVVSLVGVGIATFLLFLMTISVKPSVGIDLLIKNMNSYDPINKPSSTVFHEKTLYWNDIQYGKTYPRSFLDIYATKEKESKSKPTFIYIHGGGFLQGDKVMGDPYANNMGSQYYLPFIERGYNVVAINYAFAPEYRYPTPILQLNEAVEYLKEHADEYGLDMKTVIIGGNSAGGHIAGQFAMIQTDNKYAKEVNIEPVLRKDSIKAVVLNSALLEPTQFDESGDWTFDYQLSVAGRAYWGNDFETNKQAKGASIIHHVTKDYPSVFITDGNTASFYKQAQLFDKKLDKLGVEHNFNFYDRDEAILTHSYETILNTQQADENMDLMFKFLDEQLKNKELK